MNQSKIITELKYGFEGYAPVDKSENCEFHGYREVRDKFSCIYIVKEKDSDKEATFCFFLDAKEAIYLENVFLRERPGVRNETVYKENIYLSAIMGRDPIISIPNRGFSFRFYTNEDYYKFQKMLTEFLDNSPLSEDLQKLRNELKGKQDQSFFLSADSS